MTTTRQRGSAAPEGDEPDRPGESGRSAGTAAPGLGVLPYVQYGSVGVHGPARRIGAALLAAHLGFLVWFATRPDGATWMADSNLRPFATVHQELALGTRAALFQLVLGLVVFAPLGAILPLLGGRRDAPPAASFVHTVFGGVAVATAVEALRTTASAHLLNVDDILLAAIGVAVVHLAAVPYARLRLRRAERWGGTPPQPLPTRFGVVAALPLAAAPGNRPDDTP